MTDFLSQSSVLFLLLLALFGDVIFLTLDWISARRLKLFGQNADELVETDWNWPRSESFGP